MSILLSLQKNAMDVTFRIKQRLSEPVHVASRSLLNTRSESENETLNHHSCEPLVLPAHNQRRPRGRRNKPTAQREISSISPEYAQFVLVCVPCSCAEVLGIFRALLMIIWGIVTQACCRSGSRGLAGSLCSMGLFGLLL